MIYIWHGQFTIVTVGFAFDTWKVETPKFFFRLMLKAISFEYYISCRGNLLVSDVSTVDHVKIRICGGAIAFPIVVQENMVGGGLLSTMS